MSIDDDMKNILETISNNPNLNKIITDLIDMAIENRKRIVMLEKKQENANATEGTGITVSVSNENKLKKIKSEKPNQKSNSTFTLSDGGNGSYLN